MISIAVQGMSVQIRKSGVKRRMTDDDEAVFWHIFTRNFMWFPSAPGKPGGRGACPTVKLVH
ncbi:MAG: hypothetical protein WCH39_24075, partial [Schlesneria sp.]